MTLEKYHDKRDFTRTPEPVGTEGSKENKRLFVVQKHAARQLHYDFRLELEGVLKSWAIPKGPCLDPAAKRLAVHVEDHPLEYADFEGVIPEGEYGAGTVMIWDRGSWQPQGDAEEGYARGALKFSLQGAKLHGSWALIRIKNRGNGDKGKENWLLIKERDEEVKLGADGDIVERMPDSAQSGRTMEEIAATGE